MPKYTYNRPVCSMYDSIRFNIKNHRISLHGGYTYMQFDYKSEKNNEDLQKVRAMMDSLPIYYSKFLVGREAKMSPKTRYIYTHRILVFFQYISEYRFDNKPTTEITLNDLGALQTDDIEQFASWIRHNGAYARTSDNRDKLLKDKLDNSENTVNNYLSSISVFFNYFVRHGKIAFNPAAGVERGKKKNHEVIRLNDRQKEKFMDSIITGDSLTDVQKRYHDKAALRDETICMMLMRTGLRVSELVGLNTDDISLEDCSLTVLRKGNKDDVLYMDDELVDLVEEYLEYRKMIADPGEKAMFLVSIGKYKGTRLSVRSVERMVKKYAKTVPTADRKMSPHKLRATYATDLLTVTHDVALVQKALNHESPSTTSIYLDERAIALEGARNAIMKKRGPK